MGDKRSLTRTIRKVSASGSRTMPDQLALEEPLEIQIAHGAPESRQWKTIAITMRTPGHDRELAAGFLVGEGLLRSLDQIEAVHSRGPRYGEEGFQHSVRVTLRPGVEPDLARLERNFYTTSSCGVCGKTSIEALHVAGTKPQTETDFSVDLSVLHRLPAALRSAQDVFQSTGGIHASALFDAEGRLRSLREDVGRHNALDKLIGAELLGDRLGELGRRVLLLSGRASFELIQKAAVAGIPIVAAIGAPSSLAVDLARHYQLTLVGFLRDERCNIYCGGRRLRDAVRSQEAAAP